MNDFNILFSSAGRRVSLIRSFRESLSKLGINGKIVAADLKSNAPAVLISDLHEQVPPVSSPEYITALKNICLAYDIKLLIPLIDTELHLLSDYQHEFKSIGTTPLISSSATNKISLDKRDTYDFFKKTKIDTPEIYDIEYALSGGHVSYPLIVKPADGSCSLGVSKVWNKKELEFFKDYTPNAIIQEFVDGEEYTLDIFVDFKGMVRCVVPRLRLETRAGEVSKGVTVKNQHLINVGKQVVESLPGALGCITVQCFLTVDKKVKFLEINPRFGGGVPLSIYAGANFPQWIIEMLNGKEPEITIDGWQDGIVMLRYDDEIFTANSVLYDQNPCI